MKLISHRANLNGPDPERDNNIGKVKEVVRMGYDCEVDLWVVGTDLYLGHDEPIYYISQMDLVDVHENLWIHAKNIEALKWLKSEKTSEGGFYFNFFWHENDKFTMTSKGYMWCYPSKDVYNFGINLMPEWNELSKKDLRHCKGICSDYIERFK